MSMAPTSICRIHGAASVAMALLFVMASAAAGEVIAGQRTVTLETLSPLGSQNQIAARLLSPLARMEYEESITSPHHGADEQSLRAGEEQLDILVPEGNGRKLGVLVFLPPTDEFSVPADWRKALQRERLVFIWPRDAGNDQNVLERRVPLALNAYAYVLAQHEIDPERVYVAGFSGGARTAQMVGFGFPDIFRGVLQFSGSDPVGDSAVPPPPGELSRLLQERLRIVHATGADDEAYTAIDLKTRRSLAAICVSNVVQVAQPRIAHDLPGGRGFDRALRALLAPSRQGRDMARCREQLGKRIDAASGEVAMRLERGQLESARKALDALDLRFGWLAAPRSVELAQQLRASRDKGDGREP